MIWRCYLKSAHKHHGGQAKATRGLNCSVYSHFQCPHFITVSSLYPRTKLHRIQPFSVKPSLYPVPLSAHCSPHIARYESALWFLMASALLFSLSDSQIETPDKQDRARLRRDHICDMVSTEIKKEIKKNTAFKTFRLVVMGHLPVKRQESDF